MSSSDSATVKRIVVTGGTGYIGYAFLSVIREKHLDTLKPFALARASSDLERLHRLLDYPTPEETVLVGNLSDVDSLQPCVAHADIVVHLAADMDFFPADGQKLIRNNVDGTRNLLEACARASNASSKPLRFVYVSSTEAIGRTDGLGKVDENAPRRPESDYGRSKVLAENLVEEYKDRLATVIVRPTGVFGPGERFFFYELMAMMASGLGLISPTPMTGRVTFTHITDVVDGILLCATSNGAVGETFNLCSDETVTYRELTDTILDTLRYPRPLIFLQPWVGVLMIRLVAPLMNWGKRRIFVFHPKTVAESTVDREYCNDKLRKLGFKPKYTIVQGVEHTLKYELETGGIHRNAVPSALKRCIEWICVIVFGASRLVWGRRRGEA